MGKQTAIAMEYDDELMLLAFLNTNANITLIETFSESIDTLWKSNFEKEFPGHHTYYIWNKAFSWQPQYKQALTGKYYICNTNDAPLIEFSRSNVKENKYGRIYWAKTFSAPNGLDYDIDKFSKWYDDIVKWIKKNSTGKVKACWITYFLPHAWNLYLENSNKRLMKS